MSRALAFLLCLFFPLFAVAFEPHDQTLQRDYVITWHISEHPGGIYSVYMLSPPAFKCFDFAIYRKFKKRISKIIFLDSQKCNVINKKDFKKSCVKHCINREKK